MKRTFTTNSILVLCFTLASIYFISCGGGNTDSKSTEAPKSMIDSAPATTTTTTTTTTPVNEISKDEKLAKGKEVYTRICQACHQVDGKGIANTFPPLEKSDYIAKDIMKAMHSASHGLQGEITVNGKTYNQVMPKPNPELTNVELASVFTYVLNNFENNGGEVSVEQATAALQ